MSLPNPRRGGDCSGQNEASARTNRARDLSRKIDATASVLPDADVLAEAKIRFGGVAYRVQSVQEERLFGTLTHKTLAPVRLHAR